jgi:hypothetical protein
MKIKGYCTKCKCKKDLEIENISEIRNKRIKERYILGSCSKGHKTIIVEVL